MVIACGLATTNIVALTLRSAQYHTHTNAHTHRQRSTVTEKACSLIDLVERRGSKAYRQFVKVLEESEVDFPIGQLLRNDENHGMCMHLEGYVLGWRR